ncbi:MAG TPA: penicillin-binding protein [Candidatus Limnocylindrales bacterium]|nr:penicillin-binding protein [Candidatus Limnocylindrales bacterium]
MVERRLTFIVLALMVWCGGILYKLISLQVLHHSAYARIARKNQELVHEIPAQRGSIFDRNGEPLAMSVPTETVIVDPLKIPDLAFAADLLASFLHMDRVALYGQLKHDYDEHRGYMVVKKKITFDEGQSLRTLPVDWIEIQTENQRHYPKGMLAAHILGGVDFSGKGNAGVEKALDADLRGVPGQMRLLTDVKRRGIDSQGSTDAKPGAAITLTIDERLQYVAEKEIAAAVQSHSAASGSVVVMNPNTGDILALASYPTFDPNVPPRDMKDVIARQNHATSVPFEPGSVFKVITLSAALETTRLRPETIIDCGSGSITLFKRTIHEAHGGYGAIPMATVLAKSSNVGAIKVGMTVGQDNMYEYVRRFGFGQRTGVPLPGESRGRLRTLPQWGKTSLASISMGQEVSVTTLQLAQAASVVANGGMLVRPRLVLKNGGQLQPQATPVRVLRPDNAITMRRMMEGVVMPGGTGYPEAKLVGYSVGGKTGSAQIFDFATKHYTHNYNGSFMGFAPLTNPAIVVVVTLNGTHGSAGYGGRAAAPVFRAVASEALRVLDVPQDLPPDPPKTQVAAKKDVDGDDLAIADLGSDLPNILQDGDDDDAQTAAATAKAPANGPTVPNFAGMTMRDALAVAASKGIAIVPLGSGLARMQYPAPGSALREGERIRVQFVR